MSGQEAVLPYGTDRQLQAVALSPVMFPSLSQQRCANMKGTHENTQCNKYGDREGSGFYVDRF